MWNLEGKRISGKYLGELDVTGIVTESRVKLGGTVQHTVQLDEPLYLPWASIDGNPKTVVLLIASEIANVSD